MSSLPPSSQPPQSLPPIVNPPMKQAGMQPDIVPGIPPADRAGVQPAMQSNPPQEKNPVLHSRGLILGLLFGVTAILGLPLLWYSPAFSAKEKFWWSIAIIVYTLVLVLIAAAAWMVIYNAWTQGELSF